MTGRPEAAGVLCRGEDATAAQGHALAARLPPGSLVTLEGPLGSGKTVFIRGLAAGLGVDPGAVSSPSFVLAIEHAAGGRPLLHVDLYRLPGGAGIADLGIEDALADGYVVAVEWGERLPRALRDAAWRVRLSAGGTPDERIVEVAPPERGAAA